MEEKTLFPMGKSNLFLKTPYSWGVSNEFFKNNFKKAGAGIINLVHSWCTRLINNRHGNDNKNN